LKKTKNKEKKERFGRLFFVGVFFGVIFAFVDAQLALWFETATFPRVSSSQNLRELEEGAF
jgi:hypothetical protein